MEEKYFTKLAASIREGDNAKKYFEVENGFNYYGNSFMLQYRQTSKNYHEVKIWYRDVDMKEYKYRSTRDAITDNVIPFIRKYDK